MSTRWPVSVRRRSGSLISSLLCVNRAICLRSGPSAVTLSFELCRAEGARGAIAFVLQKAIARSALAAFTDSDVGVGVDANANAKSSTRT